VEIAYMSYIFSELGYFNGLTLGDNIHVFTTYIDGETSFSNKTKKKRTWPLGRYTPWNSHSHGLIWENL
jgi:hypothetical protein